MFEQYVHASCGHRCLPLHAPDLDGGLHSMTAATRVTVHH